MKTLTLTIILFLGIALSSCDKTSKESSKNADTMVMKKDSAIKKSDTTGFNK